MPSRTNYQQSAINIGTGTQTTIFTNPSATKFCYVWELYMSVATSTNVTFYDGAGALTGNINVLAGGTINHPDGGTSQLFTISPNANFSVSDTAGAQKSGWVHWSQ